MRAANPFHLSAAVAAALFLGACGGDGGSSPCTPATEVCDGVDNDCDGQVDEGFGTLTCGSGICLATVPACTNGTPGACVPGTAEPPEDCDGVDDDCDGHVDQGCACVDGGTQPCFTGPPGARGVGSCHDGEQTCQGGAWGQCIGEQLPVAEICNDADDDCDGATDDDDPEGGGTCDTGLLGVCSAGTRHCQGGGLACTQDLFASPEACNGLDDDCDGQVDEGNPGGGAACNTGLPGICAAGTQQCQNGAPTCAQNATASPEACNGLDDDCDGVTDPPSSSDATTWYADVDGDGFGAAGATVVACSAPAGYVANGTDCDDTNQGVNPGATEIVGDDVDQNCDTRESCYQDLDDDGYRLATTLLSLDADCADSGEARASDPAGDCDDSRATVHPGATEIVGDEVDQDCNGQEICYRDSDNDGYRVATTVTSSDVDCRDTGEALASEPSGDCNDANPAIYPGAPDPPGDGTDSDCDGVDG